MTRLNITIPDPLSEKLSHVENKSRFIAEALREKFQREEKKRLEDLLIEGYKETSTENKIINQEWEGTINDGWE